MNYTIINIIWESRAMTPTFFSTFEIYIKGRLITESFIKMS